MGGHRTAELAAGVCGKESRGGEWGSDSRLHYEGKQGPRSGWPGLLPIGPLRRRLLSAARLGGTPRVPGQARYHLAQGEFLQNNTAALLISELRGSAVERADIVGVVREIGCDCVAAQSIVIS